MNVKRDIEVIAEEAVEFSKDVEPPRAFKIFDIANKASAYSGATLSLYRSQSIRDMKGHLLQLRAAIEPATPATRTGTNIKKDILSKISSVTGTLDAALSKRPMKATVKSKSFGESIINRAEAVVRQKRK